MQSSAFPLGCSEGCTLPGTSAYCTAAKGKVHKAGKNVHPLLQCSEQPGLAAIREGCQEEPPPPLQCGLCLRANARTPRCRPPEQCTAVCGSRSYCACFSSAGQRHEGSCRATWRPAEASCFRSKRTRQEGIPNSCRVQTQSK